MKSPQEVLNLYMTSGGTKASYEDVIIAVHEEKMTKLKKKTGILFPVFYLVEMISILLNKFD